MAAAEQSELGFKKKNVSGIKSDEDADQGPTWRFWRRRRHIVAFLAFLGFCNIYALRVNLSVAIVAMTANRTVVGENGTISYEQEFDWDSKTQGSILSAFFYGYICTQLLGGWLAARIGGNRLFGIGIVATAIFTLVTPPLAKCGAGMLIGVRVVEGLFEGITLPCIHALWARWAPPMERSRIATFAFSGINVGTLVSMPVCGMLANHLGWASIFYVFGSLGVIWFAFWWWIVAEGPEMDPNISQKELKYIQDSLGSHREHTKVNHPWSKILTSLPVWSIMISIFTDNWGFYTLLTQLPTFLKDTLDFDIQNAGFLSALPYLLMGIILQFSGHLADWLVNRNICKLTTVRKLFTSGAYVSQTIFMLLTAFIFSPTGAVTCLTIAIGLGGFAVAGYSVNPLDIAPQHASVIMGISNTVGTLPGMISPLVTGYIVQNKSAEEWKIVFYIASSIYLTGAIFYAIFASGERQAWAKERTQDLKMKSSLLQKSIVNAEKS